MQQLDWSKASTRDVQSDELECLYKGWEIRLIIPNGGIIGVSVKSPDDRCWQAGSDHLKQYYNSSWHVQQAKALIDRLLLNT